MRLFTKVAMHRFRNKIAIALYLLLMAFTNFWMIWQLRQPMMQGYGDFAAFYTAGKLVRQGRAASLYDASAEWQVQQEFAPSVSIRRGPLPYIRPAFEALLFVPFAYLSYPKALLLWSLINGALLLASCALLTSSVERPLFPTGAAAVLLLGLFPFGLNFLQGQDAVLLLFLFSAAYWLLAKQASFAGGCILALGLFKFHLVVPIALIFLLRRKFRVVGGISIVAAAELLASIRLVGLSGVMHYPKYLLGNALDQGTGMTFWHNMPNLRAVLTGISGRSVPLWLGLMLSLAGVMLAAWLWEEERTQRSLAISVSLAITIAVLTSYYAYCHDLVLLAVPLLLLQNSILEEAELTHVPRMFFVVGVGLFTLTPLYWFLILRTTYLFWFSTVPVVLMTLALALSTRARDLSTAELSLHPARE
jgi:hypothetical protein